MSFAPWLRLVVVGLVAALPGLVHGAGFALFEHGNKAMAMGGAFTAVADDPSAVFWNPAGLAFQDRSGVQLQGGVTLIIPQQDFFGANPFPGDLYRASQEDQVFPPAHVYAVYPLSESVVGGIGLTSPFGLGSWWKEDYAGRFISKRADMRTFEVNPNVAVKLGGSAAVAIGVRYMAVQIDLTRDLPFFDPFTQRAVSIGQVHLATDGLSNGAWGWDAGLLARLGGGFSFGVCYRSGIDVEFDDATASFTQYASGSTELDAMLGELLPFGAEIPGSSAIDYPDLISIGVAYADDRWTVALQYGRMGWSSFQELPLTFTTRPDLSAVIPEHYDDSTQYRLGVEYVIGDVWSLRGGLVYDETPQPPESMSPLLGDADRTGISAGLGWASERLWLDVAGFYLTMDDRSTGAGQYDGYIGTYEGGALLFGATLGYRF